MPVRAIYRLHSLVLDADDQTTLGPTLLLAMSAKEITADVQVVQDITGASAPFPSSARVDTPNAGMTFSTFDIKTAVEKIPLGGLCGGKAEAYFARHDCGGIATGNVHKKYTLAATVLTGETITGQHRGDLTFNGRLLAVADGVNAPVATTQNVALPDPINFDSGSETDRWYMRDATVNGIQADGKQSLEVNYTPTVSSVGADNDSYDTWTTVDSLVPSVLVQGIDLDWFDDLGFGFAGNPINHADTSFLFAKRNTPDLTAEHIKMTVNGVGFMEQYASSGSPSDNATASFRLASALDSAGNLPLIFVTDVPA